MVQRLYLFVLLFFLFTKVVGQQVSLGQNPIAYQYYLKHFGLNGRVKSVSNYSSGNSLMLEESFDEEGRITASVSTTTTTNYSYDKSKNLIKVEVKYGNLPALVYLYQYNSNGEVEYKLYKEGDPLRQYVYNNKLLVKDSSANRYSTEKIYYSFYRYNKNGQIVQLKSFKENDQPNFEETFSYENNLVIVQGRSYPLTSKGSILNYERRNYYDAGGNLIKSAFTANGKTETTEYKLDEFGNWIWKTGGITRKILYYSNAAVSKKESSKTENKQQTVALVTENFDNNNHKWAVWKNEGSAAELTNGQYKVTVKQSNNYASWLGVPGLSGDQSKDFSIEAKFYLHSTDASQLYDSYWLLWGIGNNGKDFYAFGIYPTGKFQYGKLVNGQWFELTGILSSVVIKPGIKAANVLRVEKQKGRIVFFINGTEVHAANYEMFHVNNAGIGFQFNQKKVVDVEYLNIVQSAVATTVMAPEPHESTYQRKLTAAANSKERADALIDFFLSVKQLNYTREQQEYLLAQKFLQLVQIDFYGYYEMLLSKRINADDIKLCLRASEVLTKEQRDAVKLISQYKVDEYLATQNNSAKPSYPKGVPLPGYGWGKTVSSDKLNNTVAATTPAAVNKPAPVDPLAELKMSAEYLKGQMVYLALQKKSYFVPTAINVKSINEEITLVAIGSNFTYSSYHSRNVFGIRSLQSVTHVIKLKDLVRMIDAVSGAYVVTQIGPCKKCSGHASSWDNKSRTRSYCTACDATGCAPAYIWNNGSSRPF